MFVYILNIIYSIVKILGMLQNKNEKTTFGYTVLKGLEVSSNILRQYHYTGLGKIIKYKNFIEIQNTESFCKYISKDCMAAIISSKVSNFPALYRAMKYPID